MVDAEALLKLQDRIVREATALESEWDYLLYNVEVDNGEVDSLAVSFLRHGEGWRDRSIRLPHACCQLFADLQEQMTAGGDSWKSCTLEIEESGRYRFAFSNQAPRVAGQIDEDTTFERYVPRPL